MLRGTRPVAQRALGLIQRSNAAKSQLSFTRTITTRPTRPRPLAAALDGRLPQKASYADKPPPPPLQVGRDAEEEKRLGQQKLESDPSAVSTQSSVRHVYEPASPQAESAAKADVSDGLKHDLGIVKDTFSVAHVPRESYVLGLAGTLPYLATSMSTVFLSWNLNTEPTGSGFLNTFMLSHDSAHWWLGVIEPIQLGYGAVIISFLGAIHWGLEYAEKKPSRDRTRFRYGLGVLASVAAWPTMFLPIEFALTSQLAAFTGLYFADTTATKRGWAPYWYSSYRFVLTAIVGAAITISLIGRAKVGDAKPRLSGLSRKFHENHGEEAWSEKWAQLEDEEKEKIKKQKEEEEQKRKEEERKAEEEEKKNKKKGSKGKDEEKKKGKEAEKNEEKQDEGDDSASDESNDESGDEGGEQPEQKDESDEKAEKQEKKDTKAEKKDDKAEKKDDKAEKKEEAGDDQKEGEGEDSAKDEKKEGDEQKDDKEAKDDSKGKEKKGKK
ncbi:uncharacterized protein B0I36DRAFT_388018 [Microdochium trichocladiopsis]|uniref:Mitochondrial inner membrane protein 1 n=1 Tax=Microdochium trichocladiopsis TaxID=1682393 RepID=A0A9P8XZA4_9PEZI|nr:uncharacterized protein B0I36DRAFT_388018 [Microdochium trichocladiopsis]KAH7021279.1 hypothetical protein B0I36DRAFT_388018 [Microdochium trichocladiopsis]